MREQKIAYGSWRATSEAITAEEKKLAAVGTQWSGTCQICGKVQAAIGLVWRGLPFSGGEVWACRGGCDV